MSLVIPVSEPSTDEDYAYNENESIVRYVLKQVEVNGTVGYRCKFKDGHIEEITQSTLQRLENGSNALELFEEEGEYEESDDTHQSSSSAHSGISLGDSSEDELTSSASSEHPRRSQRARRIPVTNTSRSMQRISYREPSISSDDSEPQNQTKRRNLRSRDTRASQRLSLADDVSDDISEQSDMDVIMSDVLPRKRRRIQSRIAFDAEHRKGSKQHLSMRHSSRSTRHQKSMKEVGEGAIYKSDAETPEPTAPRATGAREVFKALQLNTPFAYRHCQQCETCRNYGGGAQGPLIFCQGCSLSYHKACLGPRNSRDHLVTKIGHQDFVLQCRRCISFQRRKEPTAPDQGMCQICREVGPACQQFRTRKTAIQEEKERQDNFGEDPIVPVNPTLINNVQNVLFRCMTCWRAFHFHHLPPKDDAAAFGVDEETIADDRFRQYGRDWACKDCVNMPAKITGLIAWRPVDQESYVPGQITDEVLEDNKEYLIKWENKSYFQAQWRPGAWTWGNTAHAMRKAFARRNGGMNLPTMNTEDAVPEDYLRIDIVLDVKYTSIVDTRAEHVDKARIREVDVALIKYKGLGYEDAVWEKVPTPEDGDRWIDFVSAYDDWVMGRYIHIPKSTPLKARLEKARTADFNTLEKSKQPENVVGGELMKYQLDGLNWLYYKWYLKQNAILADEMGLGKTIQVISFLATLVQDHNCFPFLVVVPNSTCPNWRREIKKWAPNLRCVTYYGGAQARRMAYQYELFPEASKEMRCHVVVTSYEAAADETCRKFFKGVPWQGLIVDEGHRLKNDRNILYDYLTALKCPFRLLLTGTPLQNNARELFNLLQFLDDTFDAAKLEMQYETLTKENVPVLHNMIRPFFLRRTKAQVLTFLPPMAQVILPVSMSAVQRKLYMSILAKNPELIKAIFGTNRSVKQSERANLSNILMQLRKCLCHPFVYSKEIEERSVTAAVSHRNLVEASAKLQLLELLLPKLKERGHRVLIFSQFLDMLDIIEDFMDGLTLKYQRLDGSISALQKQKRIDEFNAPDSALFAFLLSTRAGGVGINLATADTVIIMDPDFNPHQDIQALSRAHRIGQKNKVLCFQLMTRSSAEEKIVQIGRRKMALDHVLIERMDADDDAGVDVESILRHGVAEIMDDNVPDIKYDETSVDKLLDRSQIEDTKAGEDNSAESQFSFARVWANDAASMMDSLDGEESDEERAPDPGTWEKILKERERLAAQEAAQRQQTLGRGKRARQTVDYSGAGADEESRRKSRSKNEAESSDTDFQQEGQSEKDDSEMEEAAQDEHALRDLQREVQDTISGPKDGQQDRGIFKRSTVKWPTNAGAMQRAPLVHCSACGTVHEQGYCPYKLAGPEYCNLCGLAHYGVARTCPHIRSETQVREMLAALKQSPESRVLVDIASKYLQGVKGSIVQDKKRKAERQVAMHSMPGPGQGAVGGPHGLGASSFAAPPQPIGITGPVSVGGGAQYQAPLPSGRQTLGAPSYGYQAGQAPRQ